MKRFLYGFLLMCISICVCSVKASAREAASPLFFTEWMNDSQADSNSLTLTITGNTIHLQNATPGTVLEVYSVLGIKVLSVKIDASEKTFVLNLSKGCYILKIENLVRKIALK
ncbi:MAG: T9SS type A sorting domain-containing protein [Bacteroidaceae bacterium]